MTQIKNKQLYSYDDGCRIVRTLLLTDEQASVFKWFLAEGYEFKFKKLENQVSPEEIPVDLV